MSKDISDERNTFQMLWKLYHELRREDEALEYGNKLRDDKGTIISRYAGIIDARIDGGTYIRAKDMLELFSDKELEEVLREREL